MERFINMSKLPRYSCLMYHQIEWPPKHKYYVSPEAFRRQMDYLCENCIRSLSIRELDDFTSCGLATLVTFDDGHKSNLSAAEYLAEKGLIGTFYIVKDYSLHNNEYLSVADIKTISKMGHDIGVHGANHDAWTSKSLKCLVNEIADTKRWLEDITGTDILTASAPGGFVMRAQFEAITRDVGLKYIRSSKPKVDTVGMTFIGSVAIKSSTTQNEFAEILAQDLFFYSKARFVYEAKDLIKRFLAKR